MPAGLRNALIVLLLAGVVYAVPGGSKAADIVSSLLTTLLLFALAFGGWRTYRENRVAFYSLGDRNRALLYSAIGAAIVAAAGYQRMVGSGDAAGTFAWFLIVGGAVYAIVFVFREWRANA